MRKIIAFFLPIFILAACNLPRPTPDLGTAPANSQDCYFNWATQPLPELSAKIQAAFNAAGMTGVLATAEAYGENCYDAQTNKPVSFAALETDFHIMVKVTDLANKDKMGNILEKILVVLDAFPIGKIPGPQPGYIGVSFRTGSEELNLWFSVAAGESARALGLHGAALFEELQNKVK